MESDYLKTIVLGTYYVLYMIFMGLRLIKLKVLKVFNKEAAEIYKEKVALKWSRHTLKVVGMKYQVTGKENIPSENCLFVANHQSILDIPLIMDAAERPLGFVAKKEIRKVPILSSWVKELNSVFLDRKNNREAVKTIGEAIEILKKGKSMGIFPEGTRAQDGMVKDFKKGSLRLAIKSKVPIVPVAISGTYKALEKDKKLVSTTVKIHFLEPVATKDLNKEEINELQEVLKDRIIRAL